MKKLDIEIFKNILDEEGTVNFNNYRVDLTANHPSNTSYSSYGTFLYRIYNIHSAQGESTFTENIDEVLAIVNAENKDTCFYEKLNEFETCTEFDFLCDLVAHVDNWAAYFTGIDIQLLHSDNKLSKKFKNAYMVLEEGQLHIGSEERKISINLYSDIKSIIITFKRRIHDYITVKYSFSFINAFENKYKELKYMITNTYWIDDDAVLKNTSEALQKGHITKAQADEIHKMLKLQHLDLWDNHDL